MTQNASETESGEVWIGKICVMGDLFLEFKGYRQSGLANPLMTAGKKQFSESERQYVHTFVKLRLPFELQGMPTSVSWNSLVIHFSFKEHPAQISAYNLGFAEFNPKLSSICLSPDNWSYTGCMNVMVEFSEFVDLFTPVDELEQAKDVVEARKKLTGAVEKLVKRACHALNELLDEYSLLTSNFSVSRISRNDLLRFDVFQSIIQPAVPLETNNFISVMFPPGKTVSVERKEVYSDINLASAIKQRASLDETYKLAYRSYVQAQRALVCDDNASAVIHATTALEISVFYYLATTRKQAGPMDVLSRISHKSLDECERDLTLSLAFQLVLPLVVPSAIEYPTKDANACNEVRKMRNKAIHDVAKFNALYKNICITTHIDSVKHFLDFLTSIAQCS